MPLDVATEHYIAIGIAGGLWLFLYIPLLIWHGRRYYYNRNHVYVPNSLFGIFSTYSFTLFISNQCQGIPSKICSYHNVRTNIHDN